MSHHRPISIAILVVAACGGSQAGGPSAAGTETAAPRADSAEPAEPSDSAAPEQDTRPDDPVQLEPGEENEFELRDSDTAADARGEHPSEIEPTETEAAVRFFVVDKDEGPIEGIVIKMTGADGGEYFTEETDAKGFAEVLVPVGQEYQLEYLSLGRRAITAKVPLSDKPNQNIKLTLRYKRHEYASGSAGAEGGSGEPGFVLNGVRFDSGKAAIRPESHGRLDRVVEYMKHKKSARIRVAGHTDNVGNPKRNQALSEKRARAVRSYLIAKGIDGSRIEAVGYGDERPVASNETKKGRQKNRRIEAREL